MARWSDSSSASSRTKTTSTTSPTNSRGIEIYTIGFTKKSASVFFETLKQAHIQRLLDVRLNNVSQLAGFSKREDLAYFLRTICGADYVHELSLAPTQDMLTAYKEKHITWDDYEEAFRGLLTSRKVESSLNPSDFAAKRTVFLCSEATAHQCHRRVAAEYLASTWKDVRVIHL